MSSLKGFGFTKPVSLHVRYFILPKEIDDQILLKSFNYLTFVGERRALVQKAFSTFPFIIGCGVWSVKCGAWSVEY